MFIRTVVLLVAFAFFSCATYGADEIKQDAAKYPQDTPAKAMESMVKALDTNNDLGYWIAWMVTPDHTQRIIEKYKTIDAAVAANQDEQKIAGRKQMCLSIKKMLEAKKSTEGEANGVKWCRYQLSETQLIQLELQKDGRWCMNTKVRTAK